jgi:hypothetical protein
MPCQDDVAMLVRGKSACVALADGAGSKSMSHLGASLATRRITARVASNFDLFYAEAQHAPERLAETIIEYLQRSLRHYAHRKAAAIEDLACTLLFVGYQSGRFVAGHIGDGVIFARIAGEVRTLSVPMNGEYANTTYFVTDADAAKNLRLFTGAAPGGMSAMLMSDGSAESLFDRRTALPAVAVQQMIGWSDRLSQRKLKQVLRQNLLTTISQKTTDDCSLAMLTISADQACA